MTPFVRIIALSLLTAGLGAGTAFALVGQHSDAAGLAWVLGCLGLIVGTIAGAAHEIATALRQRPSKWEN